MLKILQARLQQYVNHELPDVQAGFRKGRCTRDQIANTHWIIKEIKICIERNENENTFFSPVATVEFSKFADILSVAFSQHHLLGFEIVQLEHITSNIFAHSKTT